MIAKTGNEKLFHTWEWLGLNVSNLKFIVQNDMDLSEDEIIEWRERCYKIAQDVESLARTTTEHLYKAIRNKQ